MDVLPLFPLSTCLFPNIPLNLQLFEPRYLNMISTQLKAGEGFGIVSLGGGHETGGQQEIFSIGMEVQIVDWRQQTNGLLGITVIGEEKIMVGRSWREPDELLMAEVESFPELDAAPLDEHQHRSLVVLLEELKSHVEIAALSLPEVRDTRDLASQLAYLLPLNMADKVEALSVSGPQERLSYLSRKISDMAKT